MGENAMTHFSQILVVIANSTMDDISNDHPGLPRCTFCYGTAVRSCDVIKGHQNVFLSIASRRKELRHRAWSHCVQLIKTHRMTHFDLGVTLRLRDLRSPSDLDLGGHHIHIPMRINEDLDGTIIFALARLVQKLLAKKTLVLMCRYFDIFYLT